MFDHPSSTITQDAGTGQQTHHNNVSWLGNNQGKRAHDSKYLVQDLTSQDLTSAAMMASAAEASTDPAWTHTMVFDVPERADALVVQLRQPRAGPERPSLQETAWLQASSMHKESLLARVGFPWCPRPNCFGHIQRTMQKCSASDFLMI